MPLERSWLILLLLLLPAETFLGSFVGGRLAIIGIAGPLALYVYWTTIFRLGLSPLYRRRMGTLLARLRSHPVHAGVFVAYTLVFLFSIVRGGMLGSLDAIRVAYEFIRWSAVLLLLLSVAARGLEEGDPVAVIRPIATAFLVAAGANVLLVLVGVQNGVLQQEVIATPEPALMLRALGIEFTRRVLPLGSGSWGIHNAAGLAMGLAMLRVSAGAQLRAFGAALAFSSAFGLLITDSRGGMMAGLVGGAVVFSPALLRRRATLLAWALPILPLALVMALSALQNGSALDTLSRAGGSSVGALSGRPLIWGTILVFLASFDPRHLIGFGALGQIASGVNARYGFLFSKNYATPESAGAHNTLLQTILDTGYVGALLQLTLIWFCLRGATRAESDRDIRGPWATVALAAMVAIVTLGITDATLQITTANTLTLFLALNVHWLIQERGGAPSRPPEHAPA